MKIEKIDRDTYRRLFSKCQKISDALVVLEDNFEDVVSIMKQLEDSVPEGSEDQKDMSVSRRTVTVAATLSANSRELLNNLQANVFSQRVMDLVTTKGGENVS